MSAASSPTTLSRASATAELTSCAMRCASATDAPPSTARKRGFACGSGGASAEGSPLASGTSGMGFRGVSRVSPRTGGLIRDYRNKAPEKSQLKAGRRRQDLDRHLERDRRGEDDQDPSDHDPAKARQVTVATNHEADPQQHEVGAGIARQKRRQLHRRQQYVLERSEGRSQLSSADGKHAREHGN